MKNVNQYYVMFLCKQKCKSLHNANRYKTSNPLVRLRYVDFKQTDICKVLIAQKTYFVQCYIIIKLYKVIM